MNLPIPICHLFVSCYSSEHRLSWSSEIRRADVKGEFFENDAQRDALEDLKGF